LLCRNFGSAELKVVETNLTGLEVETSMAIKTHSAEIPSPILNLGADSDLFLGSVPSGKNIPSALKSRTFRGVMEQFVYNTQRIGPWNWKVSLSVVKYFNSSWFRCNEIIMK